MNLRSKGSVHYHAKTFWTSALLVTFTLQAEDWPQWGGNDPGRNMYSPATGLPDAFDPGKVKAGTEEIDMATTKNVKWVAKLGSQSYGNVTVAGGKVFIGTNNENPRDPQHHDDRSILMCFDENTGQFLWQLVVPKLASGWVNDWKYLGILSSPAVEGNRVYLVTSRCEVICLTTDGLGKGNVGPFKDEARYIVGPGKPPIQPGTKDADIVWHYDMIGELGVFPHNGSCSSVLVVGDLVYAGTSNGHDWSHSNIPAPLAPSLIALNKKTGELVAEDNAQIGPRILHLTWGSPSAGKVSERQLIFFGGGDGFCYAFDAKPRLKDGRGYLPVVWKADCNPPEYKMKNGKPIKYPAADGPSEVAGTPVFWKNRVYVTTGQDPEHNEGVGNLVCIDATKTGDVTNTGVLWRNKEIHRSMSTVSITPEGLLFIADLSGFVHCLDAETGKSFWQYDMKAHVWGSTLVADGKVYIGDEDGDFVVFAASKEKKVLSNTIVDGKEADGPNLGAPIYSTPVVANDVLYVASSYHLYAIQDVQLAAKATPPRAQASARPEKR
jgi:outer membrane protein assembly factor BamB